MTRIDEVSAAHDTSSRVRDRFVRTAENPRLWALIAGAVILLATNKDFAQMPVHDAVEYRRIASAAPGLPTQRVGSAFSGRFFIHYLIGLIAHFTGASVDVVYALVLGILIIAILVITYLLFEHLGVSEFTICTALLVLNPFSLRPYLQQTEILQDVFFVLGLGICLFGLQKHSARVLITGLVVAVLGRQTAILVAPASAIWILCDPRWQLGAGRRRPWPTALFGVAVTFAIFGIISVWSKRFSYDYEPSPLHDSIMNLVVELPASAAKLVGHFARTAIPLVVAFAVFCALLFIVGRRNVNFPTWGGILIAAAITVQPAAIDPRFPGFVSNEQRLAALAILPLVYAVATLFGKTQRRRHGPWLVVSIVALILAASLNPKYTSIGPSSLPQFIAVELIVALAVATMIIVGYRRRDDVGFSKPHSASPTPSRGQDATKPR